MLDHFKDHDSVYIVMERLENSMDLYDYITKITVMSEELARHLFTQVIEAVKYITSMGVLHRDLKMENIYIIY